jgi:glutamyl-tRNA reductase
MVKSLRYISISHKTASVSLREQFYIADDEKYGIVKHLCKQFSDISGMLLLVTCNRTEVYIESGITTASMLQDALMSLKGKKYNAQSEILFTKNDSTRASVKHLLKVSSGLESKVLGDAEIIHQIKNAYLFSMAYHLQGSLLERAMQTIFRSHKRISNETKFRDGTTSVAYKSLKVINDTYGKSAAKTKKILFIGAGDIVVQLFKYNSKFGFNHIYISNRTEERARTLAKMHHCKVYPWKKVLENDFQDFDVIISAASNCPKLIKNFPVTGSKRVLIDLALPSNIDKYLGQNEHVLYYDLDTISVDLEDNREKRLAAIDKVKEINEIELAAYIQWLENASLRASLAKHKRVIYKKVKAYLETELQTEDAQTAKVLTNQIMKKMISQRETMGFSSQEIDALICQQASILIKAPI